MKYDKPQLLDIGARDGPWALGQKKCVPMGSAAAGDCQSGNSASQKCINPGVSPTQQCDPTGSSAAGCDNGTTVS